MSATWIVNKRQVLCAVVESDMHQKTMTTIINMIIIILYYKSFILYLLSV